MSDCEGQVNVILAHFGGVRSPQLQTKPKIQAFYWQIFRGFPAKQISSNCWWVGIFRG